MVKHDLLPRSRGIRRQHEDGSKTRIKSTRKLSFPIHGDCRCYWSLQHYRNGVGAGIGHGHVRLAVAVEITDGESDGSGTGCEIHMSLERSVTVAQQQGHAIRA